MTRVFARAAVVLCAVALLLSSLGGRSQVAALTSLQTLRTSGDPFAIAIDARTTPTATPRR